MTLKNCCFYLALLLASACADAPRPEFLNGASTRSPAPGFSLPDIHGTQFSLDEYRGKVVLLNFWAPWCFNCQSEMAAFDELYRYLPHDKFAVLAVTVLDGDSGDVKEKHGYPLLLDANHAVADKYGVTLLPVTVIVDKAGRIAPFPDPDNGRTATVFQGPRGWNSLKVVRALEELIAE